MLNKVAKIVRKDLLVSDETFEDVSGKRQSRSVPNSLVKLIIMSGTFT